MTTEADLVNEIKQACEWLRVYPEFISQRGGKGSGTSLGAADCYLHVAGKTLVIEFKRAKQPDGTPAGKLSLAQIVAIERRQEQGVETHVVDSLQGFVDVVNSARRPLGSQPRRA